MMISKCLNPKCERQLDYLRSGRVVRSLQQRGSEVHIEHYWLCGACWRIYDFRFLADGSVTIVNRPQGVYAPVIGRSVRLNPDLDRLRA